MESHKSNTKEVVGKMAEISSETKEFIEGKFHLLENVVSTEKKDAQIKVAKSQVDLY